MKLTFKKDEVVSFLSSLPKGADVALVGDQGVYLMSFAQKAPRTIVYAEGCNPNIDEDFYDNKVDAYGGDDGCDRIGTAGNLLTIANACSKKIQVILSATQIKIQADRATPVEASPKIDASNLPPELRKYLK